MKISFRCSAFALLMLMLLPAPAIAQCESKEPSVRLILDTAREQYRVGEQIHLNVEVHNCSGESFFIQRLLPIQSDWILELHVVNEKGEYSPRQVAAPPFALYDPKQSFIEALAAGWIALPPGYFYGTKIALEPAMFAFLKVPGNYQVLAKYRSDGLDLPTTSNRLAASPEELRKLPFKSWVGETERTSIRIKIVP